MLPTIFIFDIDKTLIGNVKYILDEYHISRVLNDIELKKEYKFDFKKELNEGLLRPYVHDFMKHIQQKFSPCEIFVYTNSSYQWTNGPLVKNIERALQIKINKPYFTRENSINYEKSIPEIFTKIMSVLKKKKMYDSLLLDKNKDKILKERIVLIDDIPNNLTTMNNRQLICPPYNYMSFRDTYTNLLNLFGEKLLETDRVKDSFYDRNHIIPYFNKNGDITEKDEMYYNICKSYCIRECELYMEQYRNDDYFLKLKDMLDNLEDKTIKKINIKLHV